MISDAIATIWDFFQTIWDWFAATAVALFDAVWEMLLNILFSLFDVLLSAFSTLITSIPVPVSWSVTNPLGSLSGQILYLLNAIGVVQALAILSSAYLIRFTLNLIPGAFTRV